MILTKAGLIDIDRLSYIHLFCQLFHCLSIKNIKLFGPVIYNWVALCYQNNLNPSQFDSFVKILEYRPRINLGNAIDIWVDNFKDIKIYSKELKSMGQSLGYQVEISKMDVHMKKFTKKILFTSLFSTNFTFLLRIHCGNKIDVAYDVENLYVSCSEHGIEDFNLIDENPIWEILNNPDTFGYIKNKSVYIKHLVDRIVKQEAYLYPGLAKNTTKIFQQTSTILDSGFNVMNFPGVFSFECKNTSKVCAICMEYLNDKHVETKCHHEFHRDCIFKWWETIPYNYVQCPYCRASYITDVIPYT